MTKERRRPRTALILLGVMAGLFILSGIGGIAVGGTSGQAGWWLVVVGLIFMAIVAVELARR